MLEQSLISCNPYSRRQPVPSKIVANTALVTINHGERIHLSYTMPVLNGDSALSLVGWLFPPKNFRLKIASYPETIENSRRWLTGDQNWANTGTTPVLQKTKLLAAAGRNQHPVLSTPTWQTYAQTVPPEEYKTSDCDSTSLSASLDAVQTIQCSLRSEFVVGLACLLSVYPLVFGEIEPRLALLTLWLKFGLVFRVQTTEGVGASARNSLNNTEFIVILSNYTKH